MSVQEVLFADRDALVSALADHVAAGLRAAVDRRGAAVLVVSGGSTPRPLFARLAAMNLPWSQVTVTLADDRWVPADHADSNERLLRETLLRGPGAAARLVPLKTPHDTPEAGAAACAARLQALPRPVDLVLLGMGNDGHTASLFPGGDHLTEALAEGGDRLCLPMRAPGAPQPRMTLCLPLLLDTRDLVLLCTGEDKRRTFQQAMGDGPVADMPVRAVLRAPVATRFYWAP